MFAVWCNRQPKQTIFGARCGVSYRKATLRRPFLSSTDWLTHVTYFLVFTDEFKMSNHRRKNWEYLLLKVETSYYEVATASSKRIDLKLKWWNPHAASTKRFRLKVLQLLSIQDPTCQLEKVIECKSVSDDFQCICSRKNIIKHHTRVSFRRHWCSHRLQFCAEVMEESWSIATANW